MAMSYCRLTQLRLSLNYFRRSCTSTPNPKPTTSVSKTSKKDNDIIVVEEKKENCITYELPTGICYEERKTGLQLFASKTNYAIEVISLLNAIEYTPYGIKKMWNEVKEAKLVQSQLYLKERAEFLGSEIATAHFVCFRGGKVRFYGQNDWITEDPDSDIIPSLPRFYVESYKVEAVDCSKMTLIYEGLENMKNMEKIKWLSFEGCPRIDDWCLDRISGEYSDTLEYLDIRNCTLVTEKGIASLSKLKKLKSLVLGGHPDAKNLELVCLMLEDVLPDLTIRGIIYCDESLMKNNESESFEHA